MRHLDSRGLNTPTRKSELVCVPAGPGRLSKMLLLDTKLRGVPHPDMGLCRVPMGVVLSSEFNGSW